MNNQPPERRTSCNNGFWDRDPQERAALMRAAEDRAYGIPFFDLEPSERGRAYDDGLEER